MEIARTTYTLEDVKSFFDEMQDHDRHVLADRLERASMRLAEVGTRVKPGRGDGGEWSDHEVLAHIAGLSKYYGVMVHRITSGKMSELSLLDAVNSRDGAIQQFSELEPAELLRMALTDHQRTVQTLRTAEPASLRRAVHVDDGSAMTAEEIARLPLTTHLESHVDQLERSLG